MIAARNESAPALAGAEASKFCISKHITEGIGLINTGPSPLMLAKDAITIPMVAAQLFVGWKAGKSCKSPFREERHPSFSVSGDGRLWNDFATGEGGDVVDFIAKAKSIGKGDAARELIAMAGTGGMRHWPRAQPVPFPPAPPPPQREPEPPPEMPDDVWAVWQEGVQHLKDDPSTQRMIEQWRAWPEGTVAPLVDDEVMGKPLVHGKRGIGFVVQSPFINETGLIGVRHVGFHFRHEPEGGARTRWSFHPPGGKVPALPFVTGAGFLPDATTIVVTEGQWDSLTLSAAAGWLAHETAWPERLTVFGIRGANNWRQLVTTWSPYWRKDARFVVFRDADPAGEKWEAAGGLVEALRRDGHAVDVYSSQVAGAKDLNDLMRLHPFGRETVEAWIGGGR